jgi:hypothetical protein
MGNEWFRRMRADIPGAVRLPVGWNQVLADAGLTDVTAFSYLVDVPAPLPASARGAVVGWLEWMAGVAADSTEPTDEAALARLLDPTDQVYIGARNDVFILKANTVHVGWHRDG